jgi:hypothetical protein
MSTGLRNGFDVSELNQTEDPAEGVRGLSRMDHPCARCEMVDKNRARNTQWKLFAYPSKDLLIAHPDRSDARNWRLIISGKVS